MRKIFFTSCLLLLFSGARAQMVLMQGWYWDYPKTANGFSWADTLRLKAAELKTAGFSHIWFPPHTVSGSGSGSNGFDPKDLFIGGQTTGLGTRSALNAMLAEFSLRNIAAVPDLTFNHRDGGSPETNPAVKSYITNYYTPAKEPYPSDRFRCILPLGGASGNGAGDYYFKISSKTGDNRFNNYTYKLYMQTNTVGNQGLPNLNETEPNGGGDCGQPNNLVLLGKNMLATVETTTGCNTDEFHLVLNAADFNAAGDTLFINLNNTGGIYSDHRIYGIYSSSRGTDIINDLVYQTFTNFNNLPSGRGQMDYDFFKPNNSNASTTYLNGNWDTLYFYNDYDQFQKKTQDSLIEWAKWNWDELGIRGIRMDAVKHFTPAFVSHLLDSMHKYGKDPGLVVGEWYSASTTELSNWVNTVKSGMTAAAQAAINPKVFDFALREQLRLACDDAAYDCRNLFSGSLHDATGLSGYNIVTFINNHDFRDLTGFNSLVRNNPDLAYAYILTNNQLGVPEVFYPDYYGYPAPSGGLYNYHPTNLPAYKSQVNQLLTVLKNYINGSPSVDYLNRFGTPYSSNFISGSSNKALVYQLQGFAGNNNREVIVAINFGSTSLKVDHQINTRGGAITAGTRFNDVLGRSAFSYQLVSPSGQVYIELPPKSYSVWVQNNSPVAVTLLSFNGVAAKNRNNLFWTVTNEMDMLKYTVERSVNGADFTSLGDVAALNTPANTYSYTFSDTRLPALEYLYYRLKIFARDGSFRYSAIIKLKNNSPVFDAVVFPNPARGNTVSFTLSVPARKNISATLYNVKGQKLQNRVIDAGTGTNGYSISLPVFPPGTYTLVFDDGEQQIRKAFVKEQD